MRYEKKMMLSNGKELLLRNAREDDAQLMIEIFNRAHAETDVGNEKKNVDEFKVNVLESGKYTIDVEAHHAKGRISVV